MGPEPAKERATRMWRNNELSSRFKKMKATGEGSEEFPLQDGKKYFSTEIPKPPREAPQAAEVIETDNPRVSTFERKFKKDIRAMMNEHKEITVAVYVSAIRQQKRRLLLEKLRRLEASIAQREGKSNG